MAKAYIEVELDDFDDDDVLEYARGIGFEDFDSHRLDDLVIAIRRADVEGALHHLRALVAPHGTRSRDRIEIAATRPL